MDDKDLELKTRLFWLLQLQFLEMGSAYLFIQIRILKNSGQYTPNKYTKKMFDIKLTDGIPEKDRECLATHIALQLAGVEE